MGYSVKVFDSTAEADYNFRIDRDNRLGRGKDPTWIGSMTELIAMVESLGPGVLPSIGVFGINSTHGLLIFLNNATVYDLEHLDYYARITRNPNWRRSLARDEVKRRVSLKHGDVSVYIGPFGCVNRFVVQYPVSIDTRYNFGCYYDSTMVCDSAYNLEAEFLSPGFYVAGKLRSLLFYAALGMDPNWDVGILVMNALGLGLTLLTVGWTNKIVADRHLDEAQAREIWWDSVKILSCLSVISMTTMAWYQWRNRVNTKVYEDQLRASGILKENETMEDLDWASSRVGKILEEIHKNQSLSNYAKVYWAMQKVYLKRNNLSGFYDAIEPPVTPAIGT